MYPNIVLGSRVPLTVGVDFICLMPVAGQWMFVGTPVKNTALVVPSLPAFLDQRSGVVAASSADSAVGNDCFPSVLVGCLFKF